LKEVAKERGVKKGDKFFNPDNLDESGAVSLEDAKFLYDYVKRNAPKNILEIGTWFGTSAYVMASLPYVTVQTIDQHDVFVKIPGYAVAYCHGKSKDALPVLVGNGFRYDMVFCDASLLKGDAECIINMCRPLRFLTHDYVKGQKGYENIKRMKKLLDSHKISYKFETAGIIGILEECA
jgi:predicted O-methyltransferase YrrM